MSLNKLENGTTDGMVFAFDLNGFFLSKAAVCWNNDLQVVCETISDEFVVSTDVEAQRSEFEQFESITPYQIFHMVLRTQYITQPVKHEE